LRDIPQNLRSEFAQEIGCTAKWINIGLYFEEKYGFIITEDTLKRDYGTSLSNSFLCTHLIEELAQRNVSIQSLINVLNNPNIGMNSIATKMEQLSKVLNTIKYVNHNLALHLVLILPYFSSVKVANEECFFFLCSNALSTEDFKSLIDRILAHEHSISTSTILNDGEEMITFKKLTRVNGDFSSSLIFAKLNGNTRIAIDQFTKRVSQQLPHIIVLHSLEQESEVIFSTAKVASANNITELAQVIRDDYTDWKQSINSERERTCTCQEKGLTHSTLQLTTSLNVAPNDALEIILRNTANIQTRLGFIVHRQNSHPISDEFPCFLKYWTALKHSNINTNGVVFGQLKFKEELTNVQSKLGVITKIVSMLKILFLTRGCTAVIFASSLHSYWEMWFQFDQAKYMLGKEGLTLESLSLLSESDTEKLLVKANSEQIKLRLILINSITKGNIYFVLNEKFIGTKKCFPRITN
jgi:hypothetical protein